MKDDVADLILRGVASAGARTAAFAIMDTHFHLIMFQGSAPLGWTMQPILRRIALKVHRRHGTEGHVFERRFRAKMCNDAEYLPNAILYVHRNPVAARMCHSACDYKWSSAAVFEGKVSHNFVAVDEALLAFGGAQSSVQDARENYIDRMRVTKPETLDEYWKWFWRTMRKRRNYGAQNIPGAHHYERAQLRDIRDVALKIFHSIEPAVDLELVRSRYGGPEIVKVRDVVIAGLTQRGYTGVAIAKYMRVSQSSVSRVRSRLRWSRLETMRE